MTTRRNFVRLSGAAAAIVAAPLSALAAITPDPIECPFMPAYEPGTFVV